MQRAHAPLTPLLSYPLTLLLSYSLTSSPLHSSLFTLHASRFLPPSPLRLERLDGFGHLRHHLEKIADDAVCGHFEDRRFRVFVDCDDDL